MPAPIHYPGPMKPAVPTVAAKPRKRYIAGPLYDSLFFIGSPLFALILGIWIADSPLRTNQLVIGEYVDTPAGFFIGSFIFAHLAVVFFRSHANSTIFKTFPLRFTLIPALLFTGILYSDWVMVGTSVVATWWDVYHSSLQTFGLGRIYDSKVGNDAQVGRRLDYLLNILLYTGPILAGATLFDHVEDFGEFAELDDLVAVFFTSVPARMESYTGLLTWAVVGIGVPFLAYYVLSYVRFARSGYRVSTQKVALYVLTGLCSIFTWGFNTFGEAFFIMNFFHALQYFALVWWMERDNMTRVMHTGHRAVTFVLFISLAFAYGAWAELLDGSARWALATVSVVSIMHFWYDGFIWSVRRRQV